MTIQEYIENPMGKGDAALAGNRIVTVNILKQKYRVLTEHKRIRMHCYHSTFSGNYYIHLIIPTESERDNSYDVVFEFSDKKKKHSESTSIGEYDVKVFANSPSFAYTFAYVYKKNDLLIDSLIKKLGKDFVKIAPDVRNRYQIVNYEKYIFFGAMYIMDSGILSKSRIGKEASSYVGATFPGKIRSLEEIMKEYNTAMTKFRKAKKKEAVRKKEESDRNKKEMQNIKSGIHNIQPMKKDGKTMKSNVKPIKKIKSVGKR